MRYFEECYCEKKEPLIACVCFWKGRKWKMEERLGKGLTEG